MSIRKKLIIGLAAIGLSVSAQASNINVGGAIFDPDSPADFQSNGNIYESFAGAVGDTINGFGVMNQFNGTGQGVFCPTCELTFTFSLELVAATDLGGGVSSFAFDNVSFNIWVDNTPEYDQLAPSLADASDGQLFLSAVNNGQLTGIAQNLFDVTQISGSGQGFLDVDGGLAMSNFDTNTKFNGADLQFNSSFLVAQLAVAGFPLFGSLDLSGDTIPEPTSVALIALGLLGFASTRRKITK